MYFWKNKKGEKLSFKEFMKRFKEGIETINPLQKIKVQLGGTKITLLGLFLGLFVTIYGWKKLWWVGIILIGAILNTGVQYLALRQQKKILDDLEKQFAEPDEDNSQESPNVEKLDAMPDYETTNGVNKDLMPINSSGLRTHPDTSNKLNKDKEVK